MADGTGEERPSTSLGTNELGEKQQLGAGAGPNRVINLEKTASARRTVYVPLKRRAAKFLEALEMTGNVTMARETAGLGRDRVYLHRRENAEFAAAWEAALKGFEARAEAADGPSTGSGHGLSEAELEAAGLVLRRGRGGRLQVAARKPNQWSSRIEEAFLANLAACGNVERAARAAGTTAKTVWERRLACNAFRERMEEAREEAAVRLEWMLIGEGAEMLGEDAAGKRDPQIAMWLLKRRDQERGGTLKRGAGEARPSTFEEAIEALDKKLRALRIPLVPEGSGES
jgi:hypothetical protein